MAEAAPAPAADKKAPPGLIAQGRRAVGFDHIFKSKADQKKALAGNRILPDLLGYVTWDDSKRIGANAVANALEAGIEWAAVEVPDALTGAAIKSVRAGAALARRGASATDDTITTGLIESRLGPNINFGTFRLVELHGIPVPLDGIFAPGSLYRERLEKDVINGKKTFKEKSEAIAEVAWQVASELLRARADDALRRKLAGTIAEILIRACNLGADALTLGETDHALPEVVQRTIKIGTNSLISEGARNLIVTPTSTGVNLDLRNFDRNKLFVNDNSGFGHNQVAGGIDTFISRIQGLGNGINLDFNAIGGNIFEHRQALGLNGNTGAEDPAVFATGERPSAYFMRVIWPAIIVAHPNLRTTDATGTAIERILQNIVFFEFLKKIDSTGAVQRKYADKELASPQYLAGVQKIERGIKGGVGAAAVAAKEVADGKIYVIPQLAILENAALAQKFSSMLAGFGVDIKEAKNDPKTILSDTSAVKKMLDIKVTVPKIAELDKVSAFAKTFSDIKVAFFSEQSSKPTSHDVKVVGDWIKAIESEIMVKIPDFIAKCFENEGGITTSGKIASALSRLFGSNDPVYGASFDPYRITLTVDKTGKLHEAMTELVGALKEGKVKPDAQAKLAKILNMRPETLQGNATSATAPATSLATNIAGGNTDLETFAGVAAHLEKMKGMSSEYINDRNEFWRNFSSGNSVPGFSARFKNYYIDSIADSKQKEAIIDSLVKTVDDGYLNVSNALPALVNANRRDKVKLTDAALAFDNWKNSTVNLAAPDKLDALLLLIENHPRLATLFANTIAAGEKNDYGRGNTILTKIQALVSTAANKESVGKIDPKDLQNYGHVIQELSRMEVTTVVGSAERAAKQEALIKLINAVTIVLQEADIKNDFLRIARKFVPDDAEIADAINAYLGLGAPLPANLSDVVPLIIPNGDLIYNFPAFLAQPLGTTTETFDALFNSPETEALTKMVAQNPDTYTNASGVTGPDAYKADLIIKKDKFVSKFGDDILQHVETDTIDKYIYLSKRIATFKLATNHFAPSCKPLYYHQLSTIAAQADGIVANFKSVYNAYQQALRFI